MAPVVEPPDDATELTLKTWRVLESELKDLGKDLREPVVPVLDFLKAAEKHGTTPEERRRIIREAEQLFDDFYPHMPFKTDFFQFLPPRDFLRGAAEAASERDFHGFMVAAFSIVRDAHTIYGLPSPYRGAVAFLP